MKRICVFCGSKHGNNAVYTDAARELGQLLVEHNLELVYGGGSVGLMGVVADAVLDAGGKVVGVLPERLATEELRHPGVSEMHVVSNMHERKALMASLSDAFIALPGGHGTFEELFEAITWAQLAIHHKPIGLLNAAGYYDSLIAFIEHAISEGFIKEKNRGLITIGESATSLVDTLLKIDNST